MKLFYVCASHDGENLDAIVHATNPFKAAHLWKQHYKDWDWPRSIVVYDINQTALVEGVLDWTTMPREIINVQKDEAGALK